VLTDIAKTLTDAGITSWARLDSILSSASQEERYAAGESDVTVWRVEDDSSINFPADGSPYDWYQVEVKTPPYYFSRQALDTVKKVCEVLSCTYRINCNESCGLHIHVGNGLKGFSLEILRKLYATLWTFEPQIQTIHPTHRLVGNIYCKNLRDASIMSFKTFQPGRSKTARGLELLLNNTNTVYILANEVGVVGGRPAYSMENIQDEASDALKNTIEFRQYRATLSPEESANWARFCVGLLEFADTVKEDRLRLFLERHIDHTPKDFMLGQVLVALGMPHLVTHFEALVAAKEVREGKGKLSNLEK